VCGRYTVKTKDKKLAAKFKANLSESFNAHFNIGPTFRVPVILIDPEKKERVLKLEYWGLVPYWAKNPKIAYQTTNARADTVAEKPSYKRAFKKMRCLVIMDGFFEWERSTNPKQPYYISMKDEQPFACAGLYESWKVRWEEDKRDIEKAEKTGKTPKPVAWPINLGGKKYNIGEVLESCSIITTEPNPLIAKIHDRMPVILDPKNYDAWLDPQLQDEGILKSLLKPFSDTKMQCWPVSTIVNKVGADDTDNCIKKIKL
jgi:putative SOS response-associated peptidase YedK